MSPMDHAISNSVLFQTGTTLQRRAPDIADAWIRKLDAAWSASPDKLKRLTQDRDKAMDVLSLIPGILADTPSTMMRAAATMAADLRPPRSAADLFLEIEMLEEALGDILSGDRQPPQ